MVKKMFAFHLEGSTSKISEIFTIRKKLDKFLKLGSYLF